MNNQDFRQEFASLLDGVISTSGDALESLATYAAERAKHLAAIVGEPGYDEAFQVELDNVVLAAGIASTEAADATDAKIIGLITGALRIGVAALV